MKRQEYLYHATHRENLDSVLELGLIPEFTKGVPKGRKISGVVELDSKPYKLKDWLQKDYPDDWVILGIKKSHLDPKLLSRSKFYSISYRGKRKLSDWYTYRGIISPEAIYVAG